MHTRRLGRTVRKLFQDLRFGTRYTSHRFARRYDRGKRYEGVDGGLLDALELVVSLDAVADIGCGTGQMARRLAGRVSVYFGFDVAPAMVDQARRSFRAPRRGFGRAGKYSGKRTGYDSCEPAARPAARPAAEFAVADAARVALADDSVDLVVYPWSLTSVVASCWDGDWPARVRQILAEADRVLRPEGTVAVIETANMLGESPWGEIWHPMRREMLGFLESDLGFQSVFFSNDWDFETSRNLRRYAPLWFTRETVQQVRRAGRTRIEECAGIWWRRCPRCAASNRSVPGA